MSEKIILIGNLSVDSFGDMLSYPQAILMVEKDKLFDLTYYPVLKIQEYLFIRRMLGYFFTLGRVRFFINELILDEEAKKVVYTDSNGGTFEEYYDKVFIYDDKPLMFYGESDIRTRTLIKAITYDIYFEQEKFNICLEDMDFDFDNFGINEFVCWGEKKEQEEEKKGLDIDLKIKYRKGTEQYLGVDIEDLLSQDTSWASELRVFFLKHYNKDVLYHYKVSPRVLYLDYHIPAIINYHWDFLKFSPFIFHKYFLEANPEEFKQLLNVFLGLNKYMTVIVSKEVEEKHYKAIENRANATLYFEIGTRYIRKRVKEWDLRVNTFAKELVELSENNPEIILKESEWFLKQKHLCYEMNNLEFLQLGKNIF